MTDLEQDVLACQFLEKEIPAIQELCSSLGVAVFDIEGGPDVSIDNVSYYSYVVNDASYYYDGKIRKVEIF